MMRMLDMREPKWRTHDYLRTQKQPNELLGRQLLDNYLYEAHAREINSTVLNVWIEEVHYFGEKVLKYSRRVGSSSSNEQHGECYNKNPYLTKEAK